MLQTANCTTAQGAEWYINQPIDQSIKSHFCSANMSQANRRRRKTTGRHYHLKRKLSYGVLKNWHIFSYALTSSYWLIFKLILLSESGEKINNTITKDLPPHPDIVAVKCQCLQSNNWIRDDFWKFENWSMFDELKAYEKMPIPVRDSLALFATQHRATYHDDCEQHCVDPEEICNAGGHRDIALNSVDCMAYSSCYSLLLLLLPELQQSGTARHYRVNKKPIGIKIHGVCCYICEQNRDFYCTSTACVLSWRMKLS